ncbi:MAG: 5-(carboxyamino)imidazole ribonucleotide synthase [Alphaproteobacteria bacterium]|nr:5-(carboxyamino)imidazole ribonucleotide synthase [Alphaproteobacteria bacterium]
MTGAFPEQGGVIGPGARIGILGGGQLGRMTALAAARLGYSCVILSDVADAPAAQVAMAVVADYTDPDALERFAGMVDVVTLEFENIPLETLARLEGHVSVRPGPAVLRVAQDRLLEKTFANENGVPTAPFHAVDSVADLEAGIAALGRPAVLKTRRFGYDGKGQVTIREGDDLAAAYDAIGRQPAILEGFIAFEKEVSVIGARTADGRTSVFPVVENQHQNHILKRTVAPAEIEDETARLAHHATLRLMEAMEVVGLLAVEMFVTPEGDILMNEVAPRPHNSGHWSQDGAETDQFEQLVRAVCGLPLGSTRVRTPTVMENLLGDEVNAWPSLLAAPGAKLHLYGKSAVKPGRKMGHVNRLKG